MFLISLHSHFSQHFLQSSFLFLVSSFFSINFFVVVVVSDSECIYFDDTCAFFSLYTPQPSWQYT